jgi:3,5-dihydroxyphenylacetyl-CoA synthase
VAQKGPSHCRACSEKTGQPLGKNERRMSPRLPAGYVLSMHTGVPRILNVGTSVPPNRYSQSEVLSRFRVDNPMVRKIFQASHIEGRHLYLPDADEDGVPRETQSQLLAKHRRGALELGREAIDRCLSPLGKTAGDVDMLCCITSTGFMLPGLTAMYVKHLGFRVDCHRMDLVGMGCNAGLNGLNPVTSWVKANPGKLALMVCCEVNSALYIFDDKIGTGVVNSLFGDGCAAVALRADAKDDSLEVPVILHFSSHIIPDTWRAMSYHWKEEHGKFSFNLDREVPYVLGSHADKPVRALLAPFGLKVRDISHWIVHSGGKKVIDALKYTIGITAHDVRHTVAMLRQYGNLGSGSFLFSYQQLNREGAAKKGDYGVMMTMGPGSTIESALLRW